MIDLKFIELNDDKSPKVEKIDSKHSFSSFDNMKNAGLLLTPKVVVIDFDDDNENEKKIMSYFEENYPTLVVTTNRGKHFYYEKPDNITIKLSADVVTLGGFQVDYRIGTKSYVMVKQNGINRKTNQPLRLDNLPELPLFMYPLKKGENISGFKDGDGRNTGLFNHLFRIRTQYGDSELERIANFINTTVFTDSLEEKELASIIEHASKYSIENIKAKTSWMDKAEEIITDLHCIWFENDIMFFDEDINYYSRNLNKLEYYIQNKYRYTSNFTTYQIQEVIKQISCILPNTNKTYTRNETYILCGKELVNITDNEIITNTKDIVTDVIYKYDIMSKEELEEYEKSQKLGWKFLNDISCKSEDIKTIICECLGCMLAPTKPFGKIFIWFGNGANGKSLLLKIMEEIMGDLLTHANILTINDKFGLSRAYRGIANVTDDVGITTLKETGLLKSIIDGSSIDIDRKYIEAIKWKPNSQFVMCCNEIPKIADTTRGMIRRLSFIPFNMQLTDEEIDYDLFNKLLGKSAKLNDDEKNRDALRYIMTKAIIAYRQAYKKGKLTVLDVQQELLNDFQEENKDSISLFYDYLIQRAGTIENFYKWIDKKTYEEMFSEYTKYRGYDDPKDFKETTQRSFLVNFNRKLLANNPKIKKQKRNIGGTSIDSYSVL